MDEKNVLLVDALASELGISKKQVEATTGLIDEGNTIPFIARYRKEVTGGLSDEVLRAFDDRLKYLRQLEMRKEEVLRIIEEQGKLTPELKAAIEKAKVLQKVEDLYRPFKQKKSTRASKAIERGLEPFAEVLLEQNSTEEALMALAKTFISEEKEVLTLEAVFEGAMDIIAERISDNPSHREYIRNYVLKHGLIKSEAQDSDAETNYEMYYAYEEPLSKVANHRILALNRGENEKCLKVKLAMPDEILVDYLLRQELKGNNPPTAHYLTLAISDGYKRLLSPSIEREIRSHLTERAEEDAIKVFGKNTKSLLLVPPVKGVRVLAVDPSYRTGCKLAVLDETGKLLEYKTIYPNAPQHEVEKSKQVLTDLIKKHKIDVIPIGNGTASRETESLVADLIKTLDQEVYYTIVSEAGASVYSASKLATEEYPDIDVSIRGAISIGRRLQDPLAELVKIDPKSIGVGQYQHDVNQKRLNEQLTNVVEDCVNSVGVDLNTATPSLLNYVAGISQTLSKNIVAYRDETGKFKSRKELLKVKRLGDKVYEQCAGFLRISDGLHPLDNTSVHPEAYGVTEQLLKALSYDIKGMGKEGFSDIDERISQNGGLKTLSKTLEIGEMTLSDIVQELKKPGRDPREEMPKPIFRSDVLKMEDLSPGMILTGTVRNVVDFGAFVDIGVKQDGLVHISELADRFVKNPMDVVSVGDPVEVRILSVDLNRGKVSLSMKNIEKK